MQSLIQGAGGGKKKRRNPTPQPVVQQTTVVQQVVQAPPSPSDDANTLFSKSSVRLIDLISEGEIEGFVESDGRKSIFLDDTAIRNPDGTDNFVYDNFEFRAGTQAQDYIAGFPNTEAVTSVGAAVGNAVDDSVVRTITDADADAVIVTVSIPQLFVVSNGLKQTQMKYTIDVQPNGGSYSTEVDAVVNGKCTSAYERSHRIELSGSAPWNIRLKRKEGIHDGVTNFRQLQFASFTQIIDGKLRHPLSALVGLRFEATQFQSVPTRAYDVKGIKVQIPANATVDSSTGRLSYAGVWDGSFQTAWCADPAWILRDLIISSRYGLGRFVTSAQVDKWSLFEISKYCNELVDDGQGGQEARFLCNVYLQSRDEAYNVVQDFASIFRGMAYWSAGQIAFSQDRPSDPAALFNNANVIDGNFNYEGSSLKSRHTVALVTWVDPDSGFEQQVEYVSDEDAIAKYGIIEVRTAAFGCTSRGQANRVGKWLLQQEQTETQTVTFKVGLDGAIVRPGQIIKVMDRVRAGSRKAGRISSATTTVLTIDNAMTVAENDNVSVVLPDGSVEQRTISEASTGTTITVGSAFGQTPAAQTVFVVESSTLNAQLFRVLSVVEDGEVYTITALEHNTSKYNFVEDGTQFQTRDITTLNTAPPAPEGLDVDERLVERGNSVVNEVTVSWKNSAGATAYQVSVKSSDTEAFETIGDSPYNSLSFDTDLTGSLTFRVVAINPLGKRSDPTTLIRSVAGKTALPASPQNLRFEAITANTGRLRWDQTTDLDVKVGGSVYIRHSSLTDGSATWTNSVDLIKAKAGAATEAIVPLVEGEYLVKYADDGGRLSATETSVVVDLPDALGSLIAQTRREDQDSGPFQGTHSNTAYIGEFDALVLTGTNLIDDVTDFDDLASLDFSGDIASEGTYNFASALDLGSTFSVDLKRHFVTRGHFPSDLLDDRTGNVDDFPDFDGTVADDVNAELQVRTTTDEPTSQSVLSERLGTVDDYINFDGVAPTFSSFQEFVNGTFKARGFEFRAVLTSDDVNESILVDELGYTASFQRRTEQSAGVIASGAGAKNITFDKAFFSGTTALLGADSNLPSVGITAQNLAAGDYFQITNLARTGLTVTFYNSSNVAVDRQFSYSVTGFGKAE
jgi:predicted phage tail protein